MDEELNSYWDWFREKTEERHRLMEEADKLEQEIYNLNWELKHYKYEDRYGRKCKKYEYLPRTLSAKEEELDSELRDKLCTIKKKIKDYL